MTECFRTSMILHQVKIFLKRFAILFALVLLAPVAGVSEPSTPVLWRGLQHGPYQVGVKSSWTWDKSRTFLTSRSWQGTPIRQQTARPIRLTIWYPAVPQHNARAMVYEGYFNADHEAPELHELIKSMGDYDRFSNARMFSGNQTLFRNLLQTPTAAFRDAPSAAGRFPIIIYSTGQNDYNQENVVLCEFLASHGYIVASVPDLGPIPNRSMLLVDDPASYESQIRDLEFALAETSNWPSADPGRVVAIGHSMGGIYTLLLAMRDNRIGAFIGLDPSYMEPQPSFYFNYQAAWYFDASRIKVPLLSLYRTKDHPSLSTGLLDQLRYSDRYLMGIPKLIHTDFNSYPLITANAPASTLDA